MDHLTWQLLGTLLALLTVSSGVTLWSVKYMQEASQAATEKALASQREYFDQKFTQHEDDAARETRAWRDLERRFMELQAKLPIDYVRREDWIRFSAVIDAKQDRLGDRQDQIMKQLEQLAAQLANRSPDRV